MGLSLKKLFKKSMNIKTVFKTPGDFAKKTAKVTGKWHYKSVAAVAGKKRAAQQMPFFIKAKDVGITDVEGSVNYRRWQKRGQTYGAIAAAVVGGAVAAAAAPAAGGAASAGSGAASAGSGAAAAGSGAAAAGSGAAAAGGSAAAAGGWSVGQIVSTVTGALSAVGTAVKSAITPKAEGATFDAEGNPYAGPDGEGSGFFSTLADIAGDVWNPSGKTSGVGSGKDSGVVTAGMFPSGRTMIIAGIIISVVFGIVYLLGGKSKAHA